MNTYDNNGNLTKDLNKRIASTTYNSLSLPLVVQNNKLKLPQNKDVPLCNRHRGTSLFNYESIYYHYIDGILMMYNNGSFLIIIYTLCFFKIKVCIET